MDVSECLFITLPNELIEQILLLNYTGRVVGRFVCKLFWQIVPPIRPSLISRIRDVTVTSQKFRRYLYLLAVDAGNGRSSPDIDLLYTEAVPYPNLLRWLRKTFGRLNGHCQEMVARTCNQALTSELGVPADLCIEYAVKTGVAAALEGVESKLYYPYMVRSAIEGNHLEIFKVIYIAAEKTLRLFRHEELCMAARSGSLELIQWFLSVTAIEWSSVASQVAAREGRLDVLKWLQAQGYVIQPQSLLTPAIDNGSLELIQWLLEEGGILSYRAYLAVLESGHLQLLEQLPLLVVPVTKETLMMIVAHGHTHVLDYLEAHELITLAEVETCSFIITDAEPTVRWLHVRGWSLQVDRYLDMCCCGNDYNLLLDTDGLFRFLCEEGLVKNLKSIYTNLNTWCKVATAVEFCREIPIDSELYQLSEEWLRNSAWYALSVKGICSPPNSDSD